MITTIVILCCRRNSHSSVSCMHWDGNSNRVDLLRTGPSADAPVEGRRVLPGWQGSASCCRLPQHTRHHSNCNCELSLPPLWCHLFFVCLALFICSLSLLQVMPNFPFMVLLHDSFVYFQYAYSNNALLTSEKLESSNPGVINGSYIFVCLAV